MKHTALALVLAACWTSTASTPSAVAIATLEESDLTWVHTFTGADGDSVRGALVEVGGRWYGLAGERGPNGSPNCNSGANWPTAEHKQRCPGSLFSVGYGGDLRVEHAFSQLDDAYRNLDGYHPYGSLVSGGASGWLYGVTQMGGTPSVLGARGSGVLFRFNPTSGTFETLHNFYDHPRPLDGLYPMGSPAPLPDGRVCGTTKDGGTAATGTVWCWSETDFAYASMPAVAGGAVGGVTFAAGKLHGVTNWGGEFGKGTYFTFDPDSLEVAVVDSFPDYGKPICCDDNTPIVAPLLVSNGLLLVAREFGGPTGTGLIARLDATGIHVLRELDGLEPNHPGLPMRFSNATGAMPNGAMAEGCDGMIYFTTLYGGLNGTGGVGHFARDGTRFRWDHSFGFDSGYPYGGLARGSDCALWGTTFVNGRVFRFTPKDACAL